MSPHPEENDGLAKADHQSAENDAASEGDASFRSGFVALLGEPNVGKSTLVNALLDFKVSIVSPKPQTTRDAIRGIHTDDFCQIVFVDTPGVMEPRDNFNARLRDNALAELEGADAVFHLVDAVEPHSLPDQAREALGRIKSPVFLVVNKSDRLRDFDKMDDPRRIPDTWTAPFPLERYHRVLFISALTRRGLDVLLEETRSVLPEGDYLYDPEQTTDRDMRFLAAEIVREKVLSNTEKEIPYSVATKTEEFVERTGSKHLVRVVIYVEHESQKSIIIGKGGAMLRKIGSDARPEIEEMAGAPVYLELWVKERRNWRKQEAALREFGYRPPDKKKRNP
jgi:GTP-binding protein Era